MADNSSVEARAHARTNMFIAAVLHGTDHSGPVKIRNMSPGGALIEGETIPRAGSNVRLVRGRLSVPGIIIWSSEGRCGVRFSADVSVREWMTPQANSAQQRVDQLVHLVRSDMQSGRMAETQRRCGPDVSSALSTELAGDLLRATRLIEELSDDLASDAAAVSRHADKLQGLDIAVQMVAAVANALTGEAAPENVLRLQNLRASCDEAMQSFSKPGVS